MKFTVQREILLKPLQSVTGVVEKRQTLPILSNVLLEVSNQSLFMIGTDLEVEMKSHLSVTDAEDGAITLPARKFSDICRALPEGASITVSFEDNKAILKSGRSRFVLSTLPAAEFPSIDTDNDILSFNIAQKVLKKGIDRTHFAMAQQDVRYYLNGLLFEISPDLLTLVATDGHRLAHFETKQDINVSENHSVIVPRKGVVELMRLLDDNDESIKIDLGNNYIRITTESLGFTSKLIDGRFPDYNNVLPKNADKLVTSERTVLKQSLSRAAILSNEKYRGIRLEFSPSTLRLFAHNPEQEEAEEEIAVDYSGPELEIGFNASYLLDAISAGDSEHVRISLSDSNSCCLIQGVGDEDSKYVVMPMRL